MCKAESNSATVNNSSTLAHTCTSSHLYIPPIYSPYMTVTSLFAICTFPSFDVAIFWLKVSAFNVTAFNDLSVA